MKTNKKAVSLQALTGGNSVYPRAATVRANSHQPRNRPSRRGTAAVLFALLVFQGSAMAQSAQFPMVDGKPAFLLPDSALEERLPDLGTAGAAKTPETPSQHAVPLRPQIMWRAIVPTDDIFLERAPGELQ